jgi:sister chromatid cohesion protein PDS5
VIKFSVIFKNLHFKKKGKPKQAKYAVQLIYNNFEKSKNEQILYELFKELQAEILLKKQSTFITSLISLGHICFLMPHKVGNEIKEFMSKSIVKEILIAPFNTASSSSTTTTTSDMNSSGGGGDVSGSARRKNNLKLAGKWCENEDELPFNTRARIEAVKLVIRWCLGLKSECTNIISVLKILIKLIKENSPSDSASSSFSSQSLSSSNGGGDSENIVTEAEKSRIRSTCGSKLIKLAQETSFKPLITAEYFHTLARLIIDPVTDVRDVIIKKLNRGLKSMKLPIYYMSIFALCGLDTNKERKVRVKGLYSTLIKKIRMDDAKEQTRQKNAVNSQQQQQQQQPVTPKARIFPELCLSYAVSLLAHNIKIDSLKDDAKIKQIKECMAIILDPLLEQPDAHQIAYIKKVLNKIKESDDGIMAVHIVQNTQDNSKSEKLSQNLYLMNKRLCFICEIFLFHMHSKSSNYLTNKEYQFDVKLPSGFFAARDNNNAASNARHQEKINKEVEEGLKHGLKTTTPTTPAVEDEEEEDGAKEELSKKEAAPSKKRKASIGEAQEESKKKSTLKKAEQKRKNDNDDDEDEEEEEEDNISLGDLMKIKKKNSSESKNSSLNDASNNSSFSQQEQQAPMAKRNRKNASETDTPEKKLQKQPQVAAKTPTIEEEDTTSRKSTRGKKAEAETPIQVAAVAVAKKTPARKATTASKKSNKKDVEEEEEEKENEKDNEKDEQQDVEEEEEIDDKLKKMPASRKSARSNSKSSQETNKNPPKVTSKKTQSPEENTEISNSNSITSTRPK